MSPFPTRQGIHHQCPLYPPPPGEHRVSTSIVQRTCLSLPMFCLSPRSSLLCQLLQQRLLPVCPWPFTFPLSLWLIVRGLSCNVVAICFEHTANTTPFPANCWCYSISRVRPFHQLFIADFFWSRHSQDVSETFVDKNRKVLVQGSSRAPGLILQPYRRINNGGKYL